MERHSREKKAADERQPRESRHPGSSRHHRSHELAKEVARPHKELSKTKSHRDSTHAKLPKEIVAKPLNGDDDFVRKWLVQTSLTNQDLEHPKRRETKHEPKTGQSTQAKLKHCLDQQETEEALPPARKRKHYSSSDSSILAVLTRPESQQLDKVREKTRIAEKREKPADDFLKKQREESSDSGSSDPFADERPPKETFERRARHKTREDKYEPRKVDKKVKKDGTERKPRKKIEKSDRKKAARKSGEDLMNNFSSKSIGQDRLTIRPPQGLGLFNNGRASSPARRRSLSDLAFSEMNFLQSSTRQPQVEQKSKVNSKSREKEKRKATRAQDEITEFFRPSRKPLEEIRSNSDRRLSSTKPGEKSSVYVRQVEQENRHESYSDIRSLNSRERPLVGLRQSTPFSERLTAHHTTPAIITDPRRHSRSASKASEKATTYVSWSETHLSPSVTSHCQDSVDHRRISPTPESVRRSIEKTGIFRDTGIGWSSKAAHQSERPSSPADWDKAASNQPKPFHRAKIMKSTTVPPASGSDQHLEPPHHDVRTASRKKERTPLAEEIQQLPRKKTAADDGQKLQNVGTLRTRVVVEHFDPEHGWLETSRLSPKCTSTDLPPESRSTPLNRQDLAKAARIKRPSTTLPISRIAEKEWEAPIGAISQRAINNSVVEAISNGSQVSVSANNASLIDENKAYTDAEYTFPEQSILSEEIPQQAYSRTGENTSTTSPGYDTRACGEQLLLQMNQQLPANELQENSHRSTTTSTYLGLPIRGSWHPPNTGQHRQPTPVSDQKPFFFHQMEQESPIGQDTFHTYPKVTEYEIYDILEETEPNLAHDAYEAHDTHADYTAYGSLNDNYESNVNVGDEYGTYDQSNVNQPSTNYDPSYMVNENLEPYEPQTEDVENLYQDAAFTEEEFVSQELEIPFQVVESDGYELQNADQMQGLWRPHIQY